MLPSVIPTPYGAALRGCLYLAVMLILYATGFVRGMDHEQGRLDADHAREEQAAMAQARHTVEAVRHQSDITEGVSNAYQTQLAHLVDYYNGRLRGQPARPAGTCAVPALPDPAAGAHGPAADAVPDPASGQRVDVNTLTVDCASATLQLDYLQEWVRKQQGALP